MIILVNGIGNIGTTVINLLVHYKSLLGIEEIWACKRTVSPWLIADLELLKEKGVNICTSSVHEAYPSLATILPKVNFIFETTANGVGMVNKGKYDQLESLVGACAQGSEKGFGVSFMSGVNDRAIVKQKFVHVVSCNTHGSAALMRTFAGDKLDQLKKADMVVVRRSEDLGNHERLVSANVVARHLNDTAGTHHSVDVIDLFKTIDIPCKLTSSDITTPSQLMHSVRFHIEFTEPMDIDLNERINPNTLVSVTKKYDSNVVFEQGRRYGCNGRIYSHAIILKENLLITDQSVKGWAFIPQEGNSIISTLHAYLLQTEHPNEKNVIEQIKKELYQKEW
jgi:glyceraldehyde-3-phosphate dehydrogenase (NAD(P))